MICVCRMPGYSLRCIPCARSGYSQNSRRRSFSESLVLTCRMGRWGMVVCLTNVADPSPSAQVDVAPSTGGVDQDTRGIKKNTEEPSGALRRTTLYITNRSLHGVKVPASSEEKTGSANSRPTPFRQSSPSARTAGTLHIQFFSEAFPLYGAGKGRAHS